MKYLNVFFYLTVYIFSLIKAVIRFHFGVRDPIVFNSEKISPVCRDLPRHVRMITKGLEDGIAVVFKAFC